MEYDEVWKNSSKGHISCLQQPEKYTPYEQGRGLLGLWVLRETKRAYSSISFEAIIHSRVLGVSSKTGDYTIFIFNRLDFSIIPYILTTQKWTTFSNTAGFRLKVRQEDPDRKSRCACVWCVCGVWNQKDAMSLQVLFRHSGDQQRRVQRDTIFRQQTIF